MTPGAFISVPVMGPSPRYVEGLRRRKAVIDRLCSALHEYLSLDIDEQLEAAMQPPMVARKPTIEEWEAAQREVEKIQDQIEALEKMADSLPETTGEYLEKLQMPLLESQLQHAQAWLARIQEAMEPLPAHPEAPAPSSQDQTMKKD